jgi:UDP-GlcNAc:undecaprenyl-phosphate GlcNAc-1-phosphate transferase
MTFGETLEALIKEGPVVWGLLSAALIVAVLTPLVSRIAIRAGAYDVPDRDRPRVHKQPIPRIGGLAIAVGILIPVLAFVDLSGSLAGIVIGIPVVAAIGLADDLLPGGLSASRKLLLVMAAALIPVIGYDLRFDRIGLPFVSFDVSTEVAIPVTLLWIALVANLVNLIDGMDALAAGIVGIAAAALSILAMSFGRVGVAAVAAIVAGRRSASCATTTTRRRSSWATAER